jgi:hypothetical protein
MDAPQKTQELRAAGEARTSTRSRPFTKWAEMHAAVRRHLAAAIYRGAKNARRTDRTAPRE